MASPVLYEPDEPFLVPILYPAWMYPPDTWEELYEKIELHPERLSVSELWRDMTIHYYASMEARTLAGDTNRLMRTFRESWRSKITSTVWAHDRQIHEPNSPNSLGMGTEFWHLQHNVNRYIDKKFDLIEKLTLFLPTIAEEDEPLDEECGGVN